MPLIKLMGMGYPIGLVQRAAWGGISTDPQRARKLVHEKQLLNPISNWAYAGALGVMGDMLEGGPMGKAVEVFPAVKILNDAYQAFAAVAPFQKTFEKYSKEGEISFEPKFAPMTKFLGRRLAVPAVVGKFGLMPGFGARIGVEYLGRKISEAQKPSAK